MVIKLPSSLKHKIVPTRASLVPFTFSDDVGRMAKELSGISLDVAMFNDRARFELPMLFTHRGLSGACGVTNVQLLAIGRNIDH